MNVLVIYAHPEPRSLNGSLKDFAVERLQAAGHAVEVSDLYAMHWKAVVDPQDSIGRDPGARFNVSMESRRAFEHGQQTDDIAQEQRKLDRADAVLVVFPLWWFSMPAILKGWVDRVYAYGFAYGVGEHSDHRWGSRYGEGRMVGKRAMLVVTTGGWASHYGPRGINGPIDDVLFPIQHGVLHYPGFDVLPPFVIHRTSRVDDAGFAAATDALGQRLDRLFTDAPIAYRKQNGGDYDIPDCTLRADLVPGDTGIGVHVDRDRAAG